MEIEIIFQAISTLGFPIVAVIACAWFIYQSWEKTTAQAHEQIKNIENSAKIREDRLHEQIEKFGDSLNNFNTTLVKIDARLEYIEERVNKN